MSLSLCQNCPVHVDAWLIFLLSALAIFLIPGCSWDGCSAQGGNCPAQGWAEEDGALPAQLPPGTAAPLTPAALLQWRERGGRVPGGCQENLPEHPRREPGPERGRVGRTAQTVSPAGGAANERTPAPERRLWLLVTPPWLLLTPHLWL